MSSNASGRSVRILAKTRKTYIIVIIIILVLLIIAAALFIFYARPQLTKFLVISVKIADALATRPTMSHPPILCNSPEVAARNKALIDAYNQDQKSGGGAFESGVPQDILDRIASQIPLSPSTSP
jgi:hypothetical protein